MILNFDVDNGTKNGLIAFVVSYYIFFKNYYFIVAMGNTINYYFHPEITPYDKSPIQHDPLAGFSQGARKLKEFKVTRAEIESVQVPDENIDYCLHKNLEWKACQADNFPFLSYCKPHLHRYQACMFEEHKDRQRDYERERRIMVRKQRRLEKQRRQQEQENREILNTA